MDTPASGILSFSVLAAASSPTKPGDPAAVSWRAMVELFDRFAIPATWAVPAVGLAQAREATSRGPNRHQLSLWVGSVAAVASTSRGHAVRLLVEFLASGHSTLPPHVSLTTYGRAVHVPIDLLVRHGVHVVHGTSVDRREPLRVASRRYGVWLAQPTHRLPARGWIPGLIAGDVLRAVRRSASQGPVTHVLIDLPRLLRLGNRGWGVVERLLAQAAVLRDQGNLQVTTVDQLVAERRAADRPAARSILRAA